MEIESQPSTLTPLGWFNLAAAGWAQRADYPGALNFATQWQQNPNYGLLVLLITATWYGFPFMMMNRYSPSELKGKVCTLSYSRPMVTLTSPVLIP